MIRWLFRLLVLGVVLVALYIILSPGIFKSVEANLKSQTSASSTVVSQLETPVAAISTPAHAALNPTVVTTATAASTSGSPTATPTSSSSDASSALTYNNGNSSLLKKLMDQFPDTGVAPPKGSSYDNYRFPRKY
jgi:hypothetical protein